MALLGASLSALAVVLPGAPVLVVGNGAVQLLAARLAAIRGYQTTLACVPQFIEQAKDFLWDDKYPQGSLPIKLLPIAGGDAEKGIETAAAACEGLIVAFDSEKQAMPDSALSVFLPKGSKLKRVALMSRYLNGAGMGFFPKAAKFAANAEIWAGDPDLVAQYKAQEASVRARAKEVGASTTIIRAGTLKGGASGDALMGGAGEPMFLNPAFYTIGQQDVVCARHGARHASPRLGRIQRRDERRDYSIATSRTCAVHTAHATPRLTLCATHRASRR
jgi:hypothetical protein